MARKLRKDMSPAEHILWRELRKRPGGFRFRKQFPQIGYSIDFVCLATRLGIEVDGNMHDDQVCADRDEVRDRRLIARGFEMFRIPAVEIYRNLDGVIASIVERCRELGPLHHRAEPDGPPPRSGEEV